MSRPHKPKFVQLEFNELSPVLLKSLMDKGALPNFKRLYETSQIYTSTANVPTEYLEPWIQWPTIHSGLDYDQHGIFHLGEGKKLDKHTVGHFLSDAGFRVGIFGSMNCGYESVNGYVVPDPWDETGRAHPGFLAPFVEFISRHVQESSRKTEFQLGELFRIGWFLAQHGLKADTVWSGLTQIARERRDPECRWRRAIVMERVCYDLFRYLNSKFEVDYATFFCNSTAHFQHYYWRHFEPEHFDLKPSADERAVYSTTIESGYRAMDVLVGRVLNDYPSSTIVLCTALSQKPWSNTQKCLYRMENPEIFSAFVGLEENPVRIRPVMAQQFYFDFSSETAAAKALERFNSVTLEGEAVCWFQQEGASLFGGCSVEDPKATSKMVLNVRTGHKQLFSDLFYQIYGMRSGRHDPSGSLWVRKGEHRVHAGEVPLTRIAPTVLAAFNIKPPSGMHAEALGI